MAENNNPNFRPAKRGGLIPGLLIALALIALVFFWGSRNYQARVPVEGTANLGNETGLRVGEVNFTTNPVETGLETVDVVGRLYNGGTGELRSAYVSGAFLDDQGKTIYTQTVPVEALETGDSANQVRSLADKPLGTGGNVQFRARFSSVPAAWNRQLPNLRATSDMVREGNEERPQQNSNPDRQQQ